MPRSIALWTTLRVASRSMRPPKLLQPRPTTETRRPDFPRLRSCIARRSSPAPIVCAPALLKQRREALSTPARAMAAARDRSEALLLDGALDRLRGARRGRLEPQDRVSAGGAPPREA